MDLRIGYIGLGIMGRPIAGNILKGGYPVTVHNRSREPVQALAEQGANPAYSPREVAEASDVVFTNLPDSADVELVLLGESGVIEGCREGMIWVDNSTIKPETSRRLAQRMQERGVSSLDAPVSGGDVGAQQGTLTIMVGGSRDAFERLVPVFETMGKKITHVGESGAGQVAKACNQIMVAAQMVAMGELLLLARKTNVDPVRVVEAIQGGAAQCWTLDVKPERLFSGNRQPGFKAHMMYKDLGIVMDTARTYGMPLPASAVNEQLYASMLQMGLGEQDNSGVIGVLESMADVDLLGSEEGSPGA